MNCKKSLLTAAVALALPLSVMASGGASGTKIDWIVEGELGTVVINPYDIAPLTAVIRNGGYVLTKASVRIVPKKGGQEIRYDVGPQTLLTHGGIPVWGLYADYMNTVEVRYTRVFQGKSEEKTETYKIRTAPVYFEATGNRAQSPGAFQIDVKTRPSKEFKDRLYFINNLLSPGPKSQQVVWNNPVGGAQEWANYPQNAVVDTTGETRWFMKPDAIYDPRDPFKSGIMMGFHQNDDGTLTWGYGQRYVKYDIMGREVYNRLISPNYNDFSHALSVGENGHQFLRVGSSDLRRADNTHVRTVRDVIIEVDSESGNVVDEWRLFEILDPQRNIVLKSIDQGAARLRRHHRHGRGPQLGAREFRRLRRRRRLHHHFVSSPVVRRQDRPRQEGEVDSLRPERLARRMEGQGLDARRQGRQSAQVPSRQVRRRLRLDLDAAHGLEDQRNEQGRHHLRVGL